MSLLAAHGVSLRYGAATVLADAELTVAAGDAVAVAGPNGAGKSTLLRLLAGIEQPDSGEITATGRSTCSWPGPTGSSCEARTAPARQR